MNDKNHKGDSACGKLERVSHNTYWQIYSTRGCSKGHVLNPKTTKRNEQNKQNSRNEQNETKKTTGTSKTY